MREKKNLHYIECVCIKSGVLEYGFYCIFQRNVETCFAWGEKMKRLRPLEIL